jgi:hypothetical protein
VVEVFVQYLTDKQIFVFYAPWTAMRHPSNNVLVAVVGNNVVQLHRESLCLWPSYEGLMTRSYNMINMLWELERVTWMIIVWVINDCWFCHPPLFVGFGFFIAHLFLSCVITIYYNNPPNNSTSQLSFRKLNGRWQDGLCSVWVGIIYMLQMSSVRFGSGRWQVWIVFRSIHSLWSGSRKDVMK